MKQIKLLEISSQYDKYLAQYYRRHLECYDMDYDTLYKNITSDCFAECDFIHRYFRQMGIDSKVIFFNNRLLQSKSRFYQQGMDWKELLIRQIVEFDPDVIYITDLFAIDKEMLNTIKRVLSNHVKIIGFHFSCINENILDRALLFDQLYTGNQDYANELIKHGINAFSVPHVFMPEILDRIEKRPKQGICFCGSIQVDGFGERVRLLYALIDLGIDIDIYGNIYGLENIDEILRGDDDEKKQLVKMLKRVAERAHPPLFGLEYYQCLSDHAICINLQADGNEKWNYGNLRMTEVTGVGSCLITDNKEGVKLLFDIGNEILTYSDVDDLIHKINWLMTDTDALSKISEKGQKRTLNQYTYKTKAETIYNNLQLLL